MYTDKIQQIQNAVTPVLNDAYFGPAPPPSATVHHSGRTAAGVPRRLPGAGTPRRGAGRRLLRSSRLARELRLSSHAANEVSWSPAFQETWVPGCFRSCPDFRVVGVDLRPPGIRFRCASNEMDLGREACCLQLIDLLRDTTRSRSSISPLSSIRCKPACSTWRRMWQINVAGTARVMEAISVVNRTGGNIRQFIFPSSVAAYGPETDGPVKEDAPLRAHTLPYAIHKRESDEVVRYRAESLGDCRIYILRPHIFTGATVRTTWSAPCAALRWARASAPPACAPRQAPAVACCRGSQISAEALSVSACGRHGAPADVPALSP